MASAGTRPGGAGGGDELAGEQAHLDRARACLDAMRRRAASTSAAAQRMVDEERTVDARIVAWHTHRRQRDLADDGGALCFGRIDTEDDERWYVGRRHVEDVDGSPVVVDWRASVAVPFYRATVADPFGLRLRRRYAMEGGTVAALFDEDFTDPEATVFGGLPDPLLAELERSRTGQMGDIVATIAAEQDQIIRAPLERALLVQGGPGTGKTAVGLHRAAFLLFEHRERLAERRVLIVGPNPTFLRYIANVLPSLGESAVVQTTIDGLVATRWPVRAAEEPAVAALKGDERMVELCRRLVDERISAGRAPLEVAVGATVVRWRAAELDQLLERSRSAALARNQARTVFRDVLVRDGWLRYAARTGADPTTQEAVTAALRASPVLNRAHGRMWPTLNPANLLRDLYRSAARRRRFGRDLFRPDELDLLARTPAPKVSDEPWSPADLPLLDELHDRCAGVPATYGHVVADEAQDLSPMALRMLARRAEAGSLTVLGDLAQATGVGGLRSWDDAARAFTAAGAGVQRAELTVGYRVPAPVLDVANTLLPHIAPGVTPARSVRTAGDPPLVVTVEAATVPRAAAAEVAALASRWASVGVIAPDQLHDDIVTHLESVGVDVGSSRRPGQQLDHAVVVLDPSTAKGLEFDAVVVVEPAAVAEVPNGLRHLYVALTRAVQHLGVIHARPLPPELGGLAAYEAARALRDR